HVQDHAILVESLEGERGVGRNLGEEARVGVAVGIAGLIAVVELSHWDFPEDAEALHGVAVEALAGARAAGSVGGRLHREDADGVNIVVLIPASVGALVEPVRAHAVAVAGERVEAFPGVVAAGPDGGDAAFMNDALGEALALVEARGANEAKGRAFR